MPYKDPEKEKEKKKRYKEKQAQRTRNFATVVYLESAPDNWMDIIDEMHVPALISPLHDKDVDPDGNIKKPHYHVLIMFESPKNYETQIEPIFTIIGGVGREIVNSSRGYARYLCHLDNPEKYQYKTIDVKQYGGADYLEIVQLPTDDPKLLMEIFSYIRENEIYSLAEFLDITAVHHPEWFRLVTQSRGYIVDKYLKSRQWELDTNYIRKSERGIDGSKKLEDTFANLDDAISKAIDDEE